jgi:hypothetical protein
LQGREELEKEVKFLSVILETKPQVVHPLEEVEDQTVED